MTDSAIHAIIASPCCDTESTFDQLTSYNLIVHRVMDDVELFSCLLTMVTNILVLDEALLASDTNLIAKLSLIKKDLIIIGVISDNHVANNFYIENGFNFILKKPADVSVIALTIKSAYKLAKSQLPTPNTWKLFTNNWSLATPDNTELKLTHKEFCLLHEIIKSKKDPVSHLFLCDLLFDNKIANPTNGLNKLLTGLRKKSDHHLGVPLPVKTIRSVGYIFNADSIIVD